MISQQSESVARQAVLVYRQRLRGQLEKLHPDEFVAIEPVSGDYFLGRTLSEAIGAARQAHPDRLSHALRVGHKAAVHIGIADRGCCQQRAVCVTRGRAVAGPQIDG